MMNALLVSLLASVSLGVYPTPKKVIELEGAIPNAGEHIRVNYHEVGCLGPEAYRIEIREMGGQDREPVMIEYTTAAGRFYGEQTWRQIVANPDFAARIPACIIEDSPTIARRGVVEGYYGRPWGRDGRISLLKFMGENKLNLLIYGPKDDPYHHKSWRKPYPESEKAEFREVLEVAKANFVNFTWAIHLGGTFAKSGDARAKDYAYMFAKLEDMYRLGFRSFAVFFDDSGDPDADGHAEICNRIVRKFIAKKGDVAPLVMCPEKYIGLGDNKYIMALKEKLDPAVDVMWTGIRVCCDIPPGDVAKITAAQGRKPFLWWNWPVNDYDRRTLAIGRTYGLNCAELAGFVTNPMENCEANKIGIFGCADWAWNPEGFDSQKNWRDAFGRLYADAEIAAAMKVLADHNSNVGRKDWKFDREESVGVNESTDKAKLFAEIRDAMKVLEAKLPSAEPQLWFEIEGWVRCERALVEMGLEALKGGEADKAELARARRDYVEAQRAHVEKFKAATFVDDRRRVKACEPSHTVIAPMVEALVYKEMVPRWEREHGRKYSLAGGMSTFSEMKVPSAFPLVRVGKEALIDTIYEPITLAPGEHFGVRMPAEWVTTHLRMLLAAKPPKGLVTEVSEDGVKWELERPIDSDRLLLKLDAKGSKYRFARLRNAGEQPITLKLNAFGFYVLGEYSPLDELLK